MSTRVVDARVESRVEARVDACVEPRVESCVEIAVGAFELRPPPPDHEIG